MIILNGHLALDFHFIHAKNLLPCRLGNIHDLDIGPPPPIMKSFKEFLLSLDDSVDETEAVKRYNEYKIDFRRQQMQDFFLAHKDEEWYDLGYLYLGYLYFTVLLELKIDLFKILPTLFIILFLLLICL